MCFTSQVFLTYQRGKYGGLTAVYLNFLQFVLFSDVKGQVLPFCKLAQCLCLAALPWVRRLMCALLLSTWYRGRRSFWNRLLVMMENWKWANVSLRRGAVFKSMNFNGFQYMTPANVYCVCLTIVVFFFFNVKVFTMHAVVALEIQFYWTQSCLQADWPGCEQSIRNKT